MKGVSGIVATAIMLALTIIGGVLMYTYVARFIDNFTNSAEVVITNAYYVRSLERLFITVKNIGMGTTIINEIEVVLNNGTSLSFSRSLELAPGMEQTINITIARGALPLYVIIRFNSKVTDPHPVRTVG